MIRATKVICATIVVWGATIGDVKSAVYQLTGSGNITDVGPALGGVGLPFQLGAPINFSIIFDAASSDTNASPESGLYPGAILAFGVDLNGYLASASAGDIVVNDVSGVAGDETLFESSGSVTGAAVNGHAPTEIGLFFRSPPLSSAFAGDAIPVGAIGDPAVWESIVLTSLFGVNGTPQGVTAEIGAVEATVIPVPAGLPLLAAAMLLLGLAAGRRR